MEEMEEEEWEDNEEESEENTNWLINKSMSSTVSQFV